MRDASRSGRLQLGECLGIARGRFRSDGRALLELVWRGIKNPIHSEANRSLSPQGVCPMQVVKPPISLTGVDFTRAVFLAGSIEMGTAADWQTAIAQALTQTDVTLLNPRRDYWDTTWEQRISNPQFREQVEWELDAQEQAALIVMYLDPNTKAPISLLELGLFSASGKLVVCCPDGYWRKGNVEVVCDRYSIPLVPSLKDLVTAIQTRLAA